MKREGDQVVIIVIGIRKVFDIPAQSFISRHHGQRFVMDIRHDAPLRHFLDDFIPLFRSDSRHSNKIKMIGTVHSFHMMNHM